ncbi:MAG: malonate--CoA ligase [Pikeienuella sp.]
MFDHNHLTAALRAASIGRDDAVFAHMPNGGSLSYGAFFEGAARTAQALVDCGVTPGDRVAAQVAKTVEALQLYVGTVMAGGVFLPLNTGYTAPEVDYFLSDASPRVLVCDPKALNDLTSIAEKAGVAHSLTLGADGRGSLTDAAQAATALAKAVARSGDDLAAILYTSGTTGRSKGAMLSHGALASNSQTLRDHWRFTADDVLIHALPIFHTHGLFVATNITLMAGAACIFMPGFNADEIIKAMPRATTLMGVPTFYTRLLKDERLPEASKSMRLFISGSAPLLAETHVEWEAATGHRILERYGMTETNMNTSNPYEGDRRAGTVGKPLPGVEARIMGETGPVKRGEPGVIEVRGPNVFQGYWNMPEKTAEELRPDGWFITGDIAVESEDGYITIVGRAKDMIISGGFNVYPKEIESLIDDQPGVVESAVVGVKHPDFGEGVVAVVVGSADPDAIAKAIAPELAKYKQPKRIIMVDELPRNTMGKVQKNILRETYGQIFS